MPVIIQESNPDHPYNRKFKQQAFNVSKPVITPRFSYWCCGIWGLILLIIGIVTYVVSNAVVDVTCYYEEVCADQPVTGGQCSFSCRVEKDMDAPVYAYYMLRGLYQNHRRYVKSRDFKQLRGVSITGTTENCDPLGSYGDGDGISDFVPNENLTSYSLYPCGLIAQSMFFDKFDVCVQPVSNPDDCQQLKDSNWKKDGIAWDSDKKTLFKKQVFSSLEQQTTQMGIHGQEMPDVDDEDFIVWMRTETAPDFWKLYRKISDRSLKAGDILNVTVTNNYPVKQFNARKAIVFSTMNGLGGKNTMLGLLFIIVGILCVASLGFFWIFATFVYKVPQSVSVCPPSGYKPAPLQVQLSNTSGSSITPENSLPSPVASPPASAASPQPQ